jgi:hypothetical protein
MHRKNFKKFEKSVLQVAISDIHVRRGDADLLLTVPVPASSGGASAQVPVPGGTILPWEQIFSLSFFHFFQPIILNLLPGHPARLFCCFHPNFSCANSKDNQCEKIFFFKIFQL